MKIPQVVLGAMLVGLAAQTTSCTKKSDPKPNTEQDKLGKGGEPTKPDPCILLPPAPCPACGMG